MATTYTIPDGLSQNQKKALAALLACAPCCGSGSGSGSNQRYGFTCSEAADCFSQPSAIYGTWTIGDLCTNITEHDGIEVDPDPPEAGWIAGTEPTVLGIGFYVTLGDGFPITSNPCSEGYQFSYSFMCVDRFDGENFISNLEFAAWLNLTGDSIYYHCTDFEILSCDPFLIDTGILSPAEGSGPPIRVVLSL